jgi:hypothetical protein
VVAQLVKKEISHLLETQNLINANLVKCLPIDHVTCDCVNIVYALWYCSSVCVRPNCKDCIFSIPVSSP